jgi:hypothetical protein
MPSSLCFELCSSTNIIICREGSRLNVMFIPSEKRISFLPSIFNLSFNFQFISVLAISFPAPFYAAVNQWGR